MFDRVSDSSKLGLLVGALAVVLAVPDVSGLLGCSSSGAGPGTGAGGAAGTGSGTGGGGASGTGGDGGSGTGGASGASGIAGASGASGATGSDAAAGGVGGSAAGGAGSDAGSNPDGPPAAPTITMLTPSSAHVGDPGSRSSSKATTFRRTHTYRSMGTSSTRRWSRPLGSRRASPARPSARHPAGLRAGDPHWWRGPEQQRPPFSDPPRARRRIIWARRSGPTLQPRGVRATASAESFRNCDPSGSLFNLRLAVPVEVVVLWAA